MPDVDTEITHLDLAISSIAWGFTLGFGFLTTWEAIKQTTRARNPLKSVYIWLVWGEILVCFCIGIIVYMLFSGLYKVSLVFLISLLTLWALKLHFIVQIIINRINIIGIDPDFGVKLKWGTAIIILLLNISVFVIWIPAQLNVSPVFVRINNVWDRCTKVIYLVVDVGLNWLFVRTVKRRLIDHGIGKYDKLVTFNIRIIFISLAMDLLILGSMSLSNPLVYAQIHPLAFIVKLRVELSMAKLIRKVAVQKLGPYNSPFDISIGGGGSGGMNLTAQLPEAPDSAKTADPKVNEMYTSTRATAPEDAWMFRDDDSVGNESWKRVLSAV
ncbi:hypothetical protein BZA05DRAFT_1148 [Tricharina praecox]|uniref:uncharacterized protein n=1 Tax=Tricharina praecox TaxID=43433 RepID=UPI00221FF1E9|nr:uncharacterized protein BZA05DRAFT_1148 [Tricharina praecox]KAI5858367.1 hypothetical protein BZA05DRAFT_1148 [Tricharina praecox]